MNSHCGFKVMSSISACDGYFAVPSGDLCLNLYHSEHVPKVSAIIEVAKEGFLLQSKLLGVGS